MTHTAQFELSLDPHDLPESITIIAPVHNEEDSLPPFIERLNQAMQPFAHWEVLLVDDGSTDGSVAVIHELQKQHSNIKSLVLSKNYGHQIALIAGYDHVHGEVVITLDSDLQHPPEFIPQMVAAWQKGYNIVFGRRKNFETLSPLKKLTSRLFYKLLNRISPVELVENVPDFRLMDQRVVRDLRKFQENKPFLRGIICDLGFSRVIIDYVQEERQFGTSKYGLKAMFTFAWSGIMSFSHLPLRIASYLGVLISIGSIGLAISILLFRDFFGYSVDGVPSILVGVFFLGGIQLICLGILGEYITKLFFEVKKRPRYCVEEIIDDQHSSSRPNRRIRL